MVQVHQIGHQGMNKKLLLVKLNRDYHNHPSFQDSIRMALENLLADIMAWQHEHGITFKVTLQTQRDIYMSCEVTTVVAEFETEQDYALYKLSMGRDHRVATEFKETGTGSVIFTTWKDFYDKAEIC